MQLIRSVEINYFRSIYQLRLSKLKDLNIFVGGNDSGKSNILRALSLFFNNKVSDLSEIDFLQDVTHCRQSEARDAKGRLTIWVKVTFNNIEEWKSLPETFSVKKSWNRYSNEPETTYDIENSNNLQRFLNKINFTYVPAVKDINTYSRYLRVLYETISEGQNVDLSTPAAQLSSSVNAAIKSMSDRIAQATGVSSSIDVPSDFRDLFERMSFLTKQEEFVVPLRNRGDGLQSRHIPHILEFISDQNKKYNVWAYEEPENSLEMTKSFEVARQFSNEFSKNNQIFTTSHSPSFYSLEGDSVEKFYVSKIHHSDGSSLISGVDKFSDVDSADRNLGIAHIISDRSKKLYQEIEGLRHNLSELRSFASPVILTEGKHDQSIIETAIKKTDRSSDKYTVIGCERADGEGGGAQSLRQTLESIPAADAHVRIGVFDRDTEGLSAFEGLKKFKASHQNPDIKISPSGKVFAILLPEVEWDDPYFELARRQCSIEQMFSRSVIGDDLISYRFDVSGGTIKRMAADGLIKTQGIEVASLLVTARILISDKAEAAKRIASAPPSEYQNLEKLLSTIDACL